MSDARIRAALRDLSSTEEVQEFVLRHMIRTGDWVPAPENRGVDDPEIPPEELWRSDLEKYTGSIILTNDFRVLGEGPADIFYYEGPRGTPPLPFLLEGGSEEVEQFDGWADGWWDLSPVVPLYFPGVEGPYSFDAYGPSYSVDGKSQGLGSIWVERELADLL